MELEPGIIDREPMPFGPRVSHDGMFAHFLEPLASTVNGGDAALFSHQQAIASNVADGLDETFATTIGAAEIVADNNRGGGDDQTAGALVDTGGGVDAQRDASLPYLPQSDAPIQGNFREFPTLGDGHAGNGGIDGGDPNPGKD